MEVRWSRAQSVVLAVGALLTLAGIVGTRVAHGPWITFFDNVHWTASYAAAALVATLGWRQAAPSERLVRGVFALALTAYTLGQIVWDIQVASNWNPFPGPSDALFVLLGPGMFLGLLLQTRALGVAERRSILLDMAGVTAGVLALVLTLYLPRAGDSDLLTRTTLVVYPVMTLSAAALGIVVLLELHLRLTWSLALFLASLWSCGVIWMVWNRRTLDGTLADGVLLNYIFSITALAQGVGAALWRPRAELSPNYQRACYIASRSLPLLFVIGGAAVIVLDQRLPDAAHGAVMSCVGISIVAAVARQSLLLRERESKLAAEERSRQLEARLTQAQRLESLGTLAGGIAHDFNNILMGIYGHAQILEEHVRHSSEARDSLRNMLNGCERGRDVARSILAFSRREDSARERVDLREVVTESTRLLRAALPSAIELTLDAPRVPCWVEADPGQFQRVVTNLVTNAAHALEGRQGTVQIALAARDVETSANAPLKSGNFVELSVTDSGCGMNEATRRRVFEPFFTTKGPQKGTGLGLSVVHGIVTAHGGTIEVESEPGIGTKIRICLPASAARSEPAAPLAASRSAPSLGGGREVLIVDDEEMVGAVLALMLGRLGWIPTVECDPIRALERVASDPKRFALIVTDRTMPGMNGEELTRELRRVAPESPVILSTGDAEGSADDSVYAGVLRKPYDLANLAACVNAACGDAPLAHPAGGTAPAAKG